MLHPEDIRDLIESSEYQLYLLHQSDTLTSNLLNNLAGVKEDTQVPKYKAILKIVSRWLLSLSFRIRNHIEKYTIHRQHLLSWEENGFLGADDW